MTDEHDEAATLGRRLDAFDEAPGGSNLGRYAGGALFAGVFAVGLVWVVAPEEVARFLGFGTSEAEEMQTSEPPVSISTEITRAPREPSIQIMVPDRKPPVVDPVVEPSADRIAELEERLARLTEAQGAGGLDPAELEAMLDRRIEHLREEFEQREAMLERAHEAELRAARQPPRTASLVPTDLGTAAERERAEEARARRQAILNEQIGSAVLPLDSGVKSASAGVGVDRPLTGNERFLAAASTASHETVAADRIADPSRTIVQGAVIEAVLETAVSTELPGIARAVTTRDTYGYDGAEVLLPRGSRLIGRYNSDVRIAQNRAAVAWSRAVTPSGTTVSLGGYGADTLGRSGQTGDVDNRFLERFGAAALISLIGAAPSLAVEDDANERVQDLADDFSGDARRATNSVAADYLRLGPVIEIDQGTPITVIVNRDLVF